MIVSAVRTTSVLIVIFGIVGVPILSSIVVKVCAYLMYTQAVTALLYIENCHDRQCSWYNNISSDRYLWDRWNTYTVQYSSQSLCVLNVHTNCYCYTVH